MSFPRITISSANSQKANIRNASINISVTTDSVTEKTVLTKIQLDGLFRTQITKPNGEIIKFGEITESCYGVISVNAGRGIIYVHFRYIDSFINHLFIAKYQDVRSYYNGQDLTGTQPLTTKEVDRIFLVRNKVGIYTCLNAK